MKAVIRIRLVPCIDIMKTAVCRHTVRGNGPDTWEARLTMTTNEGHTAEYTFSAENKPHALQQAYECLARHRTHLWFPEFYREELSKYQHLFGKVKGMGDRFTESMDMVEQGKRTKKEHLELWAASMAHLERIGGMLPSPTNREHVLPQDPPKKRKWYHWFWNPTD